MSTTTTDTPASNSPGLPGVLTVGWQRAKFDVRNFFRQKDAVGFTLAFPVMILLLFGAIFKGKVSPAKGDDLSKAGTHAVIVDGDLTMHGVTQHITVKGTLTTATDGSVKAQSDFEVKPEDYGIKVPGVVRAKIAEMVQVKVRLEYTKL
jgi:hypothetical protein